MTRILLFLLFFVIPSFVFGADLVPCGGPGEEACQACHLVGLVNGVITWLIGILGTIAAIIIVYAGIKLVTSGGNVSAKTAAHSMMTNVIIGFVIVLAGWLLIDTIMKAMVNDDNYGMWNVVQCVEQPKADEKHLVYSNPSTALSGVSGWGAGSLSGSMVATCDADGINSDGSLNYNCTAQVAQCQSTASTATINTVAGTVTCTSSYGGTTDSSGLGQCNPSNGACSVSALMGYGLSSEQANIMSCIAMTESSGIPSTPPYNTVHPGSNSSACGTFQIVGTTWRGAAAGACADFSNCQNASCNAQVMSSLVQSNGYSDWTCANCNNKADNCVARYSGS